ncbi:Succinyl-diaminopimelate desuccinylase [Alphaproteobacteria bacterium]
MQMLDSIKLLQQLLVCKSITPTDDGAIPVVAAALEKLGFQCKIFEFYDSEGRPVLNLYAKLGKTLPNLCFAGHVDVVPAGALTNWQFDPFAGIIDHDVVYGRGVVDMKGAIVAFITAVSMFLSTKSKYEGTISFLITGDEEGIAINGTKKLLKSLAENNEVIGACIVGEPVSNNKIGDTIKIGARGSATFFLNIKGTQGHVACCKTDNAATKLAGVLYKIICVELDNGAPFFEPSNLEITNIIVDNLAENIVPGLASAQFNVRYNNLHTASTLYKKLRDVLLSELKETEFELTYRSSGDAFISNLDVFADVVVKSIHEVTGYVPEFNTSGGTSDARFIKNYCPVLEVGLLGKTAHQINECSFISDLYVLVDIYHAIIENYFQSPVSNNTNRWI